MEEEMQCMEKVARHISKSNVVASSLNEENIPFVNPIKMN